MAGELSGLEIPPQRNLKLIPYALGVVERDYGSGRSINWDGDAGLDLKYSLTSNLTLDATVNTDFAQVEADEEQINLTRFDLFFPEKRPFFLENAGTFQFGTPQQAELFFSRRIGIDRSGLQIPIVGGARLTGKVGRYNIGMLDMQTEKVQDVAPANNFFVGRINREFRKRSNAGFIFVNREATSAGPGTSYNRAFGVDANLGLTTYWTLYNYFAKTETPGQRGQDHAARVLADYNAPLWQFRSGYTELGENFDPDVGFVRRRAYRKPEFRLQFSPQPENSWVRQYEPHVMLDRYYDMHGTLESEWQHYDYRMQLRNGGELGVQTNRYFELLRKPFEVHRGIFIPVGRYAWQQVEFYGRTDPSVALFADVEYTFGSFYRGDIKTLSSEFGFRTGATFLATLRWNNNRVELPEGDFSTNLVRLKTNYSFTPRSFVQALVQFNSQTRQFSSNVRFALINTSGTGLFLVYNERYDTEDGTWGTPLNRAFYLKYTHLFDF